MPKRNRVVLTEAQEDILALAFKVQDPTGDKSIALAREVLRLIYDRDDADCVALTSEIHVLQVKYPRRR